MKTLHWNAVTTQLRVMLKQLMEEPMFEQFRLIGGTALIEDGIRMATVEDIIAMKLEVVRCGGRKKDFWDLHILLDNWPIADMLRLHEQRYPYSHDREAILHNFTNFSAADDDLDPICLIGKHWEIIKLEIAEAVEMGNNTSH